MKVLITGAAGFIGSHLVKVFCRRHRVTALVRKTSSRRFLDRYPVEILEGDLADRGLLDAVVPRFDLVIHAAGKVSDWGSYPEFFAANVEGSLHLVEAMAPPPHALPRAVEPVGSGSPARPPRLILISSNAVLGEEDCPIPKDEAAPYRPLLPYPLESWLPSAMNHYRLTKTLAEQAVMSKAEGRGIDLTVVRPVWVFGPREFHAGPFEYCQTVLSGVPLMPGSRRNRFHVIFVEDLARLVLTIAEHQPTGLHVFNAGQPDVPLMDAFWSLFCQALGRPQPVPFPPALLLPLAILLEFLYTLAGAASPPLFTRARLTMFAADNVYAVDKVQRAFGFTSFTPLSRAVRKTVRWWRRYQFLPQEVTP
ncbi:MAG: NAD(P)-dependent oxidoreductase [Candidatus Riflebacteria bacterium]|nr:NAD(P)-dependent oxidoreductase [Candidatus Riflebacteria bacterium]